jgi:hypothetical protein
LEEAARRFDAAIRDAAGAPRQPFDDSELKASTLRRFLAALAFVERFENEVAEEYIDTACATECTSSSGRTNRTMEHL